MHYVFRFVLATLAVWRLTHLLSQEDGPWEAISRLRRALGSGMFGRLVECFYCLSIWVALPFAWFLKGDTAETVVGWLALSAAAILLERFTHENVEIKVEEGDRWHVAANQ